MKRLALILVLAVLAALIIVPGLHSHGDAGRACIACIHDLGSQALIPTPVAPAAPDVNLPLFQAAAPRASALVRRCGGVDRPRTLSPPPSFVTL
jgi:hypothetical protein